MTQQPHITNSSQSAAKLIFTSADGPTVYELKSEKVTVGRTEENDIVLDDASVSSAHAEVSLEEGKWIVRDLDSSNGTTVNGQPITEFTLSGRESVAFAGVKCLFVKNAEPSSGSSPLVRGRLIAQSAFRQLCEKAVAGGRRSFHWTTSLSRQNQIILAVALAAFLTFIPYGHRKLNRSKFWKQSKTKSAKQAKMSPASPAKVAPGSVPSGRQYSSAPPRVDDVVAPVLVAGRKLIGELFPPVANCIAAGQTASAPSTALQAAMNRSGFPYSRSTAEYTIGKIFHELNVIGQKDAGFEVALDKAVGEFIRTGTTPFTGLQYGLIGYSSKQAGANKDNGMRVAKTLLADYEAKCARECPREFVNALHNARLDRMYGSDR